MKLTIKNLVIKIRHLYNRKLEQKLTSEEEIDLEYYINLLRQKLKEFKFDEFIKIMEEKKADENYIKFIKRNSEKLIILLVDFYSFNKKLFLAVFEDYELKYEIFSPKGPKI